MATMGSLMENNTTWPTNFSVNIESEFILPNMSDSEIRKHVLDSLKNDHFGIIICFYVPVFVLAVVMNILVIIVVVKDQYMRSVTNYFLVNLSVADLFVTLVCMPNAMWKAYTVKYDFGETTCKVANYLQCVSEASSIFTITAMAIDRFLAITKPFGVLNRCFNKKTAVIVIICLWTTSSILFVKVLTVSKLVIRPIPALDMYIPTCSEDWDNNTVQQRIFGILWFIVMFAIPGFIMLFTYSMMGRTLCAVVPPFDNDEAMSCTQQRHRMMRGRKRVACILLLLAFFFMACWLPYHIIELLKDIRSEEDNMGSSTSNYELTSYMLLLGHVNSALNPVIYCVLSRKFRHSIHNLVCFEIHFSRKPRQPLQDALEWPYNENFICIGSESISLKPGIEEPNCLFGNVTQAEPSRENRDLKQKFTTIQAKWST